MKIELQFPNDDVKKLWPEIYEAIKQEIKEKIPTPLETRVRAILKEKLGAGRIRTEDSYKIFFHQAIRLAVDMDTDKMLSGIEYGRSKYGESRHSKGRIKNEYAEFDDEETN